MNQAFDPIRTIHRFISARVIFGLDATTQIAVESSRLKTGKNCIIITDPNVVKAGLLDRVCQTLRKEGFEFKVYAEVLEEPSIQSLEKVLQYVREMRPSFLVGVGGGSSLDTSKIVARAVTQPKDSLTRYLTEMWASPGLPLITMPTTAGTSAEFTRDAIAKVPDQMIKCLFDWVQATTAIVDPLMTVSMPQKVTASTGIDALSHAIELCLWKDSYPFIQASALEAVKLVSENLRRATFHGGDIEARYNMSMATQMMVVTEEGAVQVAEDHAIAHVLGPNFSIPHGTACGVALPYCMEWNLPVNTPMLARIAGAMGADVAGLSLREAASRSILEVRQLIEDVGLPTSLQQVKDLERDRVLDPKIMDLFDHPQITLMLDCGKRRMNKGDAVKIVDRMWKGRIGES